MSRWSRLLVALVVSVAALGCGGAVDQGGGDDPTQQSGGAPGAPGDRGEKAQAKEAPLEIPDIQQKDQPISEARPQIAIQFKEDVCKNREPCVDLRVRPADVDPEHCLFADTDPKAGTEVSRGAIVYLVCTPEPGYGGEQSTNSTGSTESTLPQPTETTSAPEDGQPPSSS